MALYIENQCKVDTLLATQPLPSWEHPERAEHPSAPYLQGLSWTLLSISERQEAV